MGDNDKPIQLHKYHFADGTKLDLDTCRKLDEIYESAEGGCLICLDGRWVYPDINDCAVSMDGVRSGVSSKCVIHYIDRTHL